MGEFYDASVSGADYPVDLRPVRVVIVETAADLLTRIASDPPFAQLSLSAVEVRGKQFPQSSLLPRRQAVGFPVDMHAGFPRALPLSRKSRRIRPRPLHWHPSEQSPRCEESWPYSRSLKVERKWDGAKLTHSPCNSVL